MFAVSVPTRRSLFVFAMLVVAPRLFACDSCTAHSLKYGYKHAAAVFIADVVSTSVDGAHLRVIERFKGVDLGDVDVATHGE